MVGPGHSRDEQFWSAQSVGALLVAAALISVVRHGLVGEWPAGIDGRGAAAFAIAGLALLGHSLTHGTTGRQSVNQ